MSQKSIGIMLLATGAMLIYFAFSMDETGPAFTFAFIGGFILSNGVRRIAKASQTNPAGKG